MNWKEFAYAPRVAKVDSEPYTTSTITHEGQFPYEITNEDIARAFRLAQYTLRRFYKKLDTTEGLMTVMEGLAGLAEELED